MGDGTTTEGRKEIRVLCLCLLFLNDLWKITDPSGFDDLVQSYACCHSGYRGGLWPCNKLHIHIYVMKVVNLYATGDSRHTQQRGMVACRR